MRVWEACLESRIVRRRILDLQSRTKYSYEAHTGFTSPAKSSPVIFWVCREAREAAFLYGKYQTLNPDSETYFSPVLDYLWIDPCWSSLPVLRIQGEIDSQLIELACVRKLMVHPNWSPTGQMQPSLEIAKLPSLTEILVAAGKNKLYAQSLCFHKV